MIEPKIINVKLEKDIDRKLRMIAANKEVSRSEVVRLAVEAFIAQFDVITVSALPRVIDEKDIPAERQP